MDIDSEIVTRADHLVIVAGLSGSGKTNLINQLRSGCHPEICEQLGISDLSSWEITSLRGLRTIKKHSIPKLLVHYDFYIGCVTNNFSDLRTLVKGGESVVIVTVLAPSEELVNRIKSRRSKYFRSLLHRPHAYRNVAYRVRSLYLKLRRYNNKETLLQYHMLWFKQVEALKFEQNWLVKSCPGDEPELLRSLGLDYGDFTI